MHLFAQRKLVARHWLDHHLVCAGGAHKLVYRALPISPASGSRPASRSRSPTSGRFMRCSIPTIRLDRRTICVSTPHAPSKAWPGPAAPFTADSAEGHVQVQPKPPASTSVDALRHGDDLLLRQPRLPAPPPSVGGLDPEPAAWPRSRGVRHMQDVCWNIVHGGQDPVSDADVDLMHALARSCHIRARTSTRAHRRISHAGPSNSI